VGLTQFEESSREIQILAPPGTDRPLSDPYNTPTPSQLIGKMYNIAAGIISYGDRVRWLVKHFAF
jgi:hypothetical protein